MRNFAGISLFVIIALAAVLPAGAATERFRLGKIIAAEITRGHVQINNLTKHHYKYNFAGRAYAVITVKLDPKRSLSRYDFTLNMYGQNYPCVSVVSGKSEFDVNKWIIKKSSAQDTYRMLFIVNNSPLGNKKAVFKGTLEYKLNTKGIVITKVPFNYLVDSPLSSIDSIPNSGSLKAVLTK